VAHALHQLTEARALTRRRWPRVLYRIPRPRKGLRPRLDRQLPVTGQPGRPGEPGQRRRHGSRRLHAVSRRRWRPSN